MAEERTIDDDKDKNKKYVIRRNEDGEEELVLRDEVEGEGEEEDEEELNPFMVPDLDEAEGDDEEAAVMTPEQLAERERRREIERQKREAQAEDYHAKALRSFDEQDFSQALYNLNMADELNGDNTLYKAEKFRAISCDYKNFDALDDLSECANTIKEKCTKEERAEVFASLKAMPALISSVKGEAERLSLENEEAKSRREEVFKEEEREARIYFLYAVIPFAVFLILTIVFSTIWNANEHGVYLILLIVFAVIAFILLIMSLVTLYRYVRAINHLRLNKQNSATKIGREYDECESRYETLRDIYATLGAEDEAEGTEGLGEKAEAEGAKSLDGENDIS